MSHAVPAPLVVGRHRATPVPTPARALLPLSASAPTSDQVSGKGGGRRVLRTLLSVLLSLVMLISVALFALLAVGPHLLGYRTSTMLTASMEPGIAPGDVVLTVARPAQDVQVGDVISYQIPIEDHRVETHRVTQVDRATDGTISIRTKGDNNSNVDPWTAVLEQDTVWEVQAVIPELGNLIQTMRTPLIHDLLQWVALAGLILLGLTTIWSRTDDTDADSTPAS